MGIEHGIPQKSVTHTKIEKRSEMANRLLSELVCFESYVFSPELKLSNNHDNPYLFRDTLLKLLNSENLPYETLVSPVASQA
jgi:hypothetical protein